MTNEWGPPLTGEEVKALKGRIDPAQLTCFLEDVGPEIIQYFKLPANHPYYKVRAYNQKHGRNLVLHDGSAKVPDDWAGGLALSGSGDVYDYRENIRVYWPTIIAYTPKPQSATADVAKESEVTEQMPSDEAIEAAVKATGKSNPKVIALMVEYAKDAPEYHPTLLLAARLIQQYEPDRLKPAVDVAAEEYAKAWTCGRRDRRDAFKAGAAWQKENGNV